MCPPTAYGLRGFALRLPPPPPGQHVEQPLRCATLSHPPRPFPLGRGASRPLSSRVQAARRFACFSCPLPVSVGAFQGGQGFASPSRVARVLAFGCGPRQPAGAAPRP